MTSSQWSFIHVSLVFLGGQPSTAVVWTTVVIVVEGVVVFFVHVVRLGVVGEVVVSGVVVVRVVWVVVAQGPVNLSASQKSLQKA